MKPSKAELAELVNKIRALSKELTETVSTTLVLRDKARVPEKLVRELESRLQTSSGTDETKLKKLKEEADRLRTEAAKARAGYRFLYGEIFRLNEEFRSALLHFGEDGKRISDSIENIGFSSWSAARGWPHPHGRFDEEGIPRGLLVLGKILGAALEVLFPRRHKLDAVADKRRAAIRKLCAEHSEEENYIEKICAGLQRQRMPMLANWVKDWNREHNFGLQEWDWLVAYNSSKEKGKEEVRGRIQHYISANCNPRLHSQ